MPNTGRENLDTYLGRMAEIRATGAATSETSYYSALENLLNGIGRALRPRVVANGQIRNQGAGHPDFGLYAQSQIREGEPIGGVGAIPERGVVETIGTIFARSHIPMHKWLLAIHLMSSSKKGSRLTSFGGC